MAPQALSLRVRRSTCLEASGREARRSSQRPAFGENVTQKEAHHPAKSWSGERLPAAGQRAGAQDTWGREHATGSALPGGADVGTCIPGFSTRCYFITRLTFIYFLVFTKHNTLGPEQLAFSSPEGTFTAAATEGEVPEVRYANRCICPEPEGSQNHSSQRLNIPQKVAGWKITFFFQCLT